MKIILSGLGNQGTITFTKEANDPQFHGLKFAKGEHALFYFLKKWFNEHGFDFIKKRAQRDGHMVGDEFQPYLRSRKGEFCIISGFYALRGANEDWNKGSVSLQFHGDIFTFRKQLKEKTDARD